jgi:hypothetical protein
VVALAEGAGVGRAAVEVTSPAGDRPAVTTNSPWDQPGVKPSPDTGTGSPLPAGAALLAASAVALFGGALAVVAARRRAVGRS